MRVPTLNTSGQSDSDRVGLLDSLRDYAKASGQPDCPACSHAPGSPRQGPAGPRENSFRGTIRGHPQGLTCSVKPSKVKPQQAGEMLETPGEKHKKAAKVKRRLLLHLHTKAKEKMASAPTWLASGAFMPGFGGGPRRGGAA